MGTVKHTEQEQSEQASTTGRRFGGSFGSIVLGRILLGLFLGPFLALHSSPVGAQVFGQNKVQYRNLQWSTLKSKHFEIYFHKGEREVAPDVARMAERAYDRLSRILDHEIDKPVPIVLYASATEFQQTNVTTSLVGEGTGGFTEFVKRRVTVPLGGSYREFDHVLTHELVHAFQVDILSGGVDHPLNGALRYTPPLWFMEGMAEYLSLGEVDPMTAMWLRDGALQGYLTPLQILERVGDIRIYRYGQAVLAYLGAAYGDHTIGEVLKRIPRARGLSKAFEDAVGLTLEKFSEDWVDAMRRRYLPEIKDHSRPDEFAYQLTRAEKDLSNMNVTPAVSPDGNRLVYFSDRALYTDLYLASALDGGGRRRLVKGERKPDFESLRFYQSAIEWSPQGGLIAFTALAGGRDALCLQRVSDGKIVRRLRPDLDAVSSPTWSPDGQWIAFGGLKGGRSNLYRVRVDGSGLEQLTDERYLVQEPKWFPDGKSILFVSDRGSATDLNELRFARPSLVELDLATREIRILPGQSGSNISPGFFPDGKHLIFVSDRSGIANLYIRDLETNEDRRITDVLTGIAGVAATPISPVASLSRNGKRVVFSSFNRGSWDLFAIKNPLDLWEKGVKWDVPPSLSVDVVAAERSAVAPARADSSIRVPANPAGAGKPDSLTARVEDLPAPPPGDSGDSGDSRDSKDRRDSADSGESGDQPLKREWASSLPDSSRLALKVRRVLDSNEPLADPSTFEIQPYHARFSADYVAANGFFAGNVGLAAQSVLQFSDMLGNQVLLIGANVYGSISDADLLLEYVNLQRRLNWGVSVFQFRNDYYLFASESSSEYLSQVYRGVNLTVQRPFDRFRRLELSTQFLSVSEQAYLADYLYDVTLTNPASHANYKYVSPGIALVSDNTIYGPTGPIEGGRSRLSLDVGLGDLSFQTYTADLRSYLNVRHEYALALRTIGATSQGRDPQYFRLGGPYTIRGYAFGEIRGTHLILGNLEFRFPLVRELLIGFPLSVGLQGVRGALFFDAGATWDDSHVLHLAGFRDGHRRLDDLKASYGLSASLNVGFTVVRWDLAWKTDLVHNLGPATGYLSFGWEY